MSGAERIAARLSAAIASIPHGWGASIEWIQDDWPTARVTLTRDFGKIWEVGHGNHRNACVAIEVAITEAVRAVLAREARDE